MQFQIANNCLQSQEGEAASTVASHSHISVITQQQQHQEQGAASLAHTNYASITSNSHISFQTQAPIFHESSMPDTPVSVMHSTTEQWRERFNKKVFDTDFSPSPNAFLIRFRSDSSKQSTDKNYTQADIDIMILIVEKWNCDDNTTRIAFHREHKTGFRWAKDYEVRSSKLENETIKTLLRLTNKGKYIVCTAQDVFDAILNSHCKSVGHFATRKTKDHLDETYWNITKLQVTAFIDLCYICNTRNDTVRTKDKGPGVSIKSAGFRDRFQVD